MRTPPDPRKASNKVDYPPSAQPQAKSIKRPSLQKSPPAKRIRQDITDRPASVNGNNNAEDPPDLPIVERLRCLEVDYSAQGARVAELEKLVSALQREVFGGARDNTNSKEGEPVLEPLRAESSNSGARAVAQASQITNGASGIGLVKLEDNEDVESRLYSASPFPPGAPVRHPPTAPQMPHPIRNMRPIYSDLPIPKGPTETFSHTLLQTFLGGQTTSDGYYKVGKSRSQFYPVKSWYALVRDREPYAPPAPGHHGAKLSIFMQVCDEEADDSAPLFIRSGKGDYTYHGSYREPRFSDRLDYSRMVDEVAPSVKEYWAKALTSRTRPGWVMRVFLEEGLISKETVTMEDGSINEELAFELMEGFTAAQILKAFETPDAVEDEPSMRLYWEYFECVGYDVDLYMALVAKKMLMSKRSESP